MLLINVNHLASTRRNERLPRNSNISSRRDIFECRETLVWNKQASYNFHRKPPEIGPARFADDTLLKVCRCARDRGGPRLAVAMHNADRSISCSQRLR